jgi:hypothetical protein
MPHGYAWKYFPDLHDFQYTADIHWPGQLGQVDWIDGIILVEDWLLTRIGSQYQRWAWNTATEVYDISVAFKYDKHRTLFLLAYS